MPKFRTNAQNSLMFGLAAKAGVSHDDLRDWTAEITAGRTEHTSELYYSEAVEIIDRLQKLFNPDQTPRRTVNYRRQKTGVEQIVTPDHLQKMVDLWFAKKERTSSGLESLCLRVIKLEKPRTAKECSKVIEAIKAMNSRERALGAFAEKEAK